jgi:DNA-binding NtrC family response regulator
MSFIGTEMGTALAPNGTRMLMLVDNEPAQVRLVSALASRAGWRTIAISDNETAIATLGTRDGMMLDAILIDRWGDGVADLISELRARRPMLPILMLTATDSVAIAVEAMRAGASDFLVKPIAPDRLLAALEAAMAEGSSGGELRPLSEKISAPLGFDEIVGSAPKFRAALAIAAKAARARVPMLVEGESGVGKEVVAEAIHAASPRAKKPLVAVNCGAIPANLVESELFGHEKGAFTGAFSRQVGKFVDADGGTLFLDEVGDLPLDAQVKLLRVLQSGEVCPIGGRPREVDVRIVAATNRTLLDEVAAGRFREDLYYRLAVVQVTIPPLRDRSGDVPALARHLLARIAKQPGLRELGITDEAMSLLGGYAWPGNVRQLQNALFRAAVLCDGDALTATDFPHIASLLVAGAPVTDHGPQAAGVTLFHSDGNMRALDAIEADVIRLAIGHYRGRMTEVARRLGIGRSTLYRKLAELGISDAA